MSALTTGAELKEVLAKCQGTLTSLTAQRDYAIKDISAKRREQAQREHRQALMQEVNAFFSGVIEHQVSEVKAQIEELVNSGLATIFEYPISIRIDSAYKNNKTVFNIVIAKDELEGAQEAHGGGVLAIIAFLFRVVVNAVTGKAKFMMFDESLTYVSAKYQEPLSAFIAKLCEDLGYTIVLISHQPLLNTYAHRAYNVERNAQGFAKFKETKANEG